METAKKEVRQILDSPPDDATFEDIQYRIYVWQVIAAGIRDVDEGRVVSQEEVERRMSRWTEK
jgi:predicted transcriptional regulator